MSGCCRKRGGGSPRRSDDDDDPISATLRGGCCVILATDLLACSRDLVGIDCQSIEKERCLINLNKCATERGRDIGQPLYAFSFFLFLRRSLITVPFCKRGYFFFFVDFFLALPPNDLGEGGGSLSPFSIS